MTSTTGPFPTMETMPSPAGQAVPAPRAGFDPMVLFPYQEPKRDRFTAAVVRLLDRARWLSPAAVAAGVGAAVTYTFLVHPTSAYASSHPTCIVKLLTGFDCPGCGGTRAAWYLMHGDIAAAARHHAPLVFATPFLIYMYVAWALKTTFGWNLPQIRITPRAVGIFMGAWAAFSVLRNLPWSPFTWLYV